jgi:hypothetical protein
MRLALDLDGLDRASRRLALDAARRAEELFGIRPARVVVRADAMEWPLGSEAWPGGAAMPPAALSEPRDPRP